MMQFLTAKTLLPCYHKRSRNLFRRGTHLQLACLTVSMGIDFKGIMSAHDFGHTCIASSGTSCERDHISREQKGDLLASVLSLLAIVRHH